MRKIGVIKHVDSTLMNIDPRSPADVVSQRHQEIPKRQDGAQRTLVLDSTGEYNGVGSSQRRRQIHRDKSSPQLEGFRARGIEVLLLPDQIDSFWVTAGVDFEGKPFKSVTQGIADLSLIPLPEGERPAEAPSEAVGSFIAFVKVTLGDAVSDVRASERLTESAVCLVAAEGGMDRQMEKRISHYAKMQHICCSTRRASPMATSRSIPALSLFALDGYSDGG